MESGGRQVGKSPNGTINTITSTQGEWKSEKRNGILECSSNVWYKLMEKSILQAYGATSAVSETEDRTSMVPASTGVGTAAWASICATRAWGITMGRTPRSPSVTETTLTIFRPKTLAIASALAFPLVEPRRKACSWALCSSLRVKDR